MMNKRIKINWAEIRSKEHMLHLEAEGWEWNEKEKCFFYGEEDDE
jgi:hypothetical protein